MKRNEYYVVWCDYDETYFLALNKLDAIDMFDRLTRIYNKKNNDEYLTFLEIVSELPDEEKLRSLDELFDEIFNNTDTIHVCELVEFVDFVMAEHCDGYEFASSWLIQDLYQQIKERGAG